MERLSAKECRVTFHCHTSKINWAGVSLMGYINMLEHYSYLNRTPDVMELQIICIKNKYFGYIVTYVDSHLHTCTYICRITHNDTTTKTDAWRITQEGRHSNTSLTTFLPLTLLQGFERVVQGLQVRGCWRPNINFIFWPHCYDRHVVSFLFSWCWGLLHRGFPRAPSVGCGLPYYIWSQAVWNSIGNCSLGQVWLSLPHLVSNSLEVCWQLYRGFPSAPSVGYGLPYHIWSLLSGTLLATALAPQTQLS